MSPVVSDSTVTEPDDPRRLAGLLQWIGWLDERVRLAVDDSRWWRAVGRVGLEAAPPTIGALALIGGLFALAPAGPSIGDAVGLYLVGIAVLTVPHTAIVTWIDRRQGLWL